MSDFILNRIIQQLNKKNLSEKEINEIREHIISDSDNEFDVLDIFKKSQQYQHLFNQSYYRGGFINRLLFQYLEGFSEFEIFNEQILGLINEYNKAQYDTSQLYRALKVIFIRSNLIVKEIECLIKNGFASGALARWRSLFEYSIFSLFILKYGEQTAKRFLDHIGFENSFDAESYNKYVENFGYKKLSLKAKLQIEKQQTKLKEKYGDDFLVVNGWAADQIKRGTRKTMPFDDIIKKVEQEDMLLYYNYSCKTIHANSKNVFVTLGSMYGIPIDDDKILGNSSNIGFTDPIQLTMYSFLIIAEAFLSLHPTKDLLEEIAYLRHKIKKVAEKTLTVERKIKKQEKSKQPQMCNQTPKSK